MNMAFHVVKAFKMRHDFSSISHCQFRMTELFSAFAGLNLSANVSILRAWTQLESNDGDDYLQW
jgi:hypothetical protein